MFSLALAQLSIVASLACFQDEAPPAPPIAQPAPVLVPGEAPASASAEARAAWLELCKAASGASAQPKVTSFDLRFDGRAQPVGRETHDFNDARYRYLEPGWIATTLADGTQRMRGPGGDFFVKDKIATRLQGSNFATDLRELDDQARVAHSFVSLIDPRALRLRSLALVKGPPPVLPASLAKRASELTWLEIESPDFHSGTQLHPGTQASAPVFSRAWIGTDKQTRLPQLALVARADGGTIVHESALLVRLEDFKPIDGFQVPHKLRSYQPDLGPSPWTFSEQPVLTLWLKGGSLRPALVEKDFLPPAKR